MVCFRFVGSLAGGLGCASIQAVAAGGHEHASALEGGLASATAHPGRIEETAARGGHRQLVPAPQGVGSHSIAHGSGADFDALRVQGFKLALARFGTL